jgi:hypothetical protein
MIEPVPVIATEDESETKSWREPGATIETKNMREPFQEIGTYV